MLVLRRRVGSAVIVANVIVLWMLMLILVFGWRGGDVEIQDVGTWRWADGGVGFWSLGKLV